MSYISWKDYRLAHGGPSRKTVPTSNWEPIDRVVEASESLVERETRLDIERVANKVDDNVWSGAMSKALTDMKKLAGSLLLVLAAGLLVASMASCGGEGEVVVDSPRVEILVNDNFIDVLDVQYLGDIDPGRWATYVYRITDMDACLVFYTVGNNVTQVIPVTESMTNTFGKLEHCFGGT